MIFNGGINEYLQLVTIAPNNCNILKEAPESSLTLLWFEDNTSVLKIDSLKYTFRKDQIVCLTEFHRVEVQQVGKIRLLRFNRPFYCILDHDSEVGCKGILFFGAHKLPILNIENEELEKFDTLWKMFGIEMASKDDLQLEMLRMMLKRTLILCTRIYKKQQDMNTLEHRSFDLIREFNFLVEGHFKQQHSVAAYAEMLHKSPKTISNLFAKISDKTPLQFIQDRILLEARRLLRYTDKPIKEIAIDLGYEDIQSFSRFFKTKELISPSEFRESM